MTEIYNQWAVQYQENDFFGYGKLKQVDKIGKLEYSMMFEILLEKLEQYRKGGVMYNSFNQS